MSSHGSRKKLYHTVIITKNTDRFRVNRRTLLKPVLQERSALGDCTAPKQYLKLNGHFSQMATAWGAMVNLGRIRFSLPLPRVLAGAQRQLCLQSSSPQHDTVHCSDIVGHGLWNCGFGNSLQPICSPSQQVRNVEQLRRPPHEWKVKDRERITGSGLLDVFSWLEVTIVSDKTKSKGRSSRRGNRLALFGWVHSRWESKLDERLLSERGRQLNARLCSGVARDLVPSESWGQLSADGKAEPCSHLRHVRV